MANVRFDYDAKMDSLFLYDPNKKANASTVLGDIVLDFSKNVAVSLEMFNASQFIADCLEGYSPNQIKKILKNIVSCKIQYHKRRNRLHVQLIIIPQEGKEIRPILNFVSATETSPLLAHA